MYQRFSAHINSVDIPDFSDLKETARETANRVESALSRGSSSSISSATGVGTAAAVPPSPSGITTATLPPTGLGETRQPPLRTASVSDSATNSVNIQEPTTAENRLVIRSQSVKQTIDSENK